MDDAAIEGLGSRINVSGGSSYPSERDLAGGGYEGATNGSKRPGRALGWLSLGLGAAQLAVPQMLASGVGLRKASGTTRLMRLVGARELLAGVGILRRRHTRGWLWARVAGDLMDLALLGTALKSVKKRRRGRLPVALLAVAGVAVLDLVVARRAGKENHLVPSL